MISRPFSRTIAETYIYIYFYTSVSYRSVTPSRCPQAPLLTSFSRNTDWHRNKALDIFMILNCARVRPAAFAVISIAFNALRTRHYWHFFRILFSFLLLFFRVGKYTRVIYLSKNKKKKTERGIGRGLFTGVGAGNDGTEGNVSKLIRTVRFPPRSRQHTRGRINIVFARKLPEDKKIKNRVWRKRFRENGSS